MAAFHTLMYITAEILITGIYNYRIILLDNVNIKTDLYGREVRNSALCSVLFSVLKRS